MANQAAVGLVGGGLLMANLTVSGQGKKLFSILWNHSSGEQIKGQYAALGGEILLLFALYLLAGASPQAASIAMWLLVAFWLAWLINNAGTFTTWLASIGVAKK